MSKHTQGMVIKRLTREGTNCLYIANEMSANEFVKTDWDANCEYINHCLNMHREMLEALKAIRELHILPGVFLKSYNEIIARAEKE